MERRPKAKLLSLQGAEHWQDVGAVAGKKRPFRIHAFRPSVRLRASESDTFMTANPEHRHQRVTVADAVVAEAFRRENCMVMIRRQTGFPSKCSAVRL